MDTANQIAGPNLKRLGHLQRSILLQLVFHPDWKIINVYDSGDCSDEAYLKDEDDNDIEEYSEELPQDRLTKLVERNLFHMHTLHKCIDPDIDITTLRLTETARAELQTLFSITS